MGAAVMKTKKEPKKLGRPRKHPPIEIPSNQKSLLSEIRRKALEAVYVRQMKGKPLRTSDYAFLARCEQEAKAPADAAQKKAIGLRPLTYFQKLGEAQDMALSALVDQVRNGKGVARSSAAKILLDKGRQEAPPKSNKVIIRFNPIGEETAEA